MDYNELYKYINKLFSTYFYTYKLDDDEKNDAIQDCILKVLEKEKSGILEPSIEKNKNYIFITIKNYLIHFNTQKFKKKTYQLNDNMVAYYDYNLEDEINRQFELNSIKQYLNSNNTSAVVKLIIFRILNDFTWTEIADELELSERQVKQKLYNFIQRINRKTNYKYKIIFNDGREQNIINKKKLLQTIKMSPDTFNGYAKLNKTTFKNYKIEFLTKN